MILIPFILALYTFILFICTAYNMLPPLLGYSTIIIFTGNGVRKKLSIYSFDLTS